MFVAGFLAAALAPRGRSVIAEEAGHPVNFDQPEAFNGVLTGFVMPVSRS